MRLLFVLFAVPLYSALILTAAHCERWLTSAPEPAPLPEWIAASTSPETRRALNIELLAPLALDIALLLVASTLYTRVADYIETRATASPLLKKPIQVIIALVVCEVRRCRY
jgi:hypothetical protein